MRGMLKDYCKPIFWAFGFIVLFLLIGWGLRQFTNANLTDVATSINAIGILVAICVGGVFAYQRLQIFRTFEPHLTISHEVSHRFIGDSYVHIGVDARLRNSSNVHIELRKGFFLLQRISPSSDEEIENLYAKVYVDEEYEDIQWPVLYEVPREWDEGTLIIEPSESHQEICEFIISTDTQSVMVYTYFYNPNSSTPEGWGATTVYDIVDSR